MRTKKNRGNRQRRGGGTRQRSKKQEYIHPALYQKQGSFGMSTFSKENIPVGTIIIREKINNVKGFKRLPICINCTPITNK